MKSEGLDEKLMQGEPTTVQPSHLSLLITPCIEVGQGRVVVGKVSFINVLLYPQKIEPNKLNYDSSTMRAVVDL